MVRIILRDDDLNSNCSDEDSEIFNSAADVFDEVVLSIVPSPRENSLVGSQKKYFSELEQNPKFIKKIHTLLKKNNVSLSMHGLNHSGYGEFGENIDINKIMSTKRDMERLFNVNINTFTPPNNILNKHNYLSLQKLGFTRIISAFSNWPFERPLNYCYLDHFLRSSILAIRRKKDRRVLRRLNFNTIEEYPSFIAYTKENLENIIDNIIISKPQKETTIVIATHYWELWKSMPNKLLSLPDLIRCRLKH